jgi:hypothetical protein
VCSDEEPKDNNSRLMRSLLGTVGVLDKLEWEDCYDVNGQARDMQTRRFYVGVPSI